MARTIAEIQDQMIAGIQADADLAGINSPSKRALWRLWTYIVAVAISVFEQILDIAKADLETIVRAAPPATNEWIRNKMLEFQYDPDVPQYVQLIDMIPQYPKVDEALRIITRCSVNVRAYHTVSVKVAKGEPPEPLSDDQLNAARDYMYQNGIAGIYYSLESLPPDRLYVNADIYFKPSQLTNIQTSMKDALDGYLAAIPFDGVMKIVDLIDAMKSLPGVTDVVLHNVAARRSAAGFDERTKLIENNTQLTSKWQTIAGYMIGEDSAGNTFQNTLNYITQ